MCGELPKKKKKKKKKISTAIKKNGGGPFKVKGSDENLARCKQEKKDRTRAGVCKTLYPQLPDSNTA